MAPELNWTSLVETFLKSLFGYLYKKRTNRRSNGDNANRGYLTSLAIFREPPEVILVHPTDDV